MKGCLWINYRPVTGSGIGGQPPISWQGSAKPKTATAGDGSVSFDVVRMTQLEALFESFINLINLAIDEKSPYTGGHCQRVPALTMMLAEAVNDTTEGPLASFQMTDRDRYGSNNDAHEVLMFEKDGRKRPGLLPITHL